MHLCCTAMWPCALSNLTHTIEGGDSFQILLHTSLGGVSIVSREERILHFPVLDINRQKKWPRVAAPAQNTAVHMSYLSDNGVAAQFLEAVRTNTDAAWAFVSKLYAPGLDLNALREVLWAGAHCKWVYKARCGHGAGSKHFMTRSLYVSDPERNFRRLLHLRLVKEPDKYGPWKICGIEQEDCPRGL